MRNAACVRIAVRNGNAYADVSRYSWFQFVLDIHTDLTASSCKRAYDYALFALGGQGKRNKKSRVGTAACGTAVPLLPTVMHSAFVIYMVVCIARGGEYGAICHHGALYRL